MRAAPLALTLLAAALLLPVLLAACGGGEDSVQGDLLSERFLRLGEDLETEVEVYDGALPPALSDALNPGRTEETPDEDLVALPVHPNGVLLGSYRLRRDDGINTFILFYDVDGDDRTVETALREQLDQSPWQVIGGQSTESLSWVSFQSTISGDVDGQAAITPLPPVESEDGGTLTLSNHPARPAPLCAPALARAARRLPVAVPARGDGRPEHGVAHAARLDALPGDVALSGVVVRRGGALPAGLHVCRLGGAGGPRCRLRDRGLLRLRGRNGGGAAHHRLLRGG